MMCGIASLPLFGKLLTESVSAMRQIPGVQDAAVGLTLPYERALLNAVRLSSGKEAARTVTTNQVYVTPRYFETLQIPVLAGRTFTDADGPDAQPVVIVNRTFARKFFDQESPVGQYLDEQVLIVGVVADTVLSAEAQVEPGNGPVDTRGNHLCPGRTGGRSQAARVGPRLLPTKLDCPNRHSGRGACADAACPGKGRFAAGGVGLFRDGTT